MWVDSPELLTAACQEISTALEVFNVLAVDLEYHNVQRHATVICLIQLSTYSKDYIIDSLLLRDNDYYGSLRTIFESASIVKLVHGGDTDVQLLASDLNICAVNVFDTARGYQYLQKLPQTMQNAQMGVKDEVRLNMNLVSLEKLVKIFLDVDLDKSF
jgi:ribonuclease D